ncbi:hypothetical protein ACF3NG_06815 [Aerococcaceae bacterium WGS1372]
MKFGVSKNILRTSKYTAIAVTISKDTTGVIDVNGHKILPAGTVLAGVGGSVFDDETQARVAVKATGEAVADGVLLNDTDVTEKDAAGACVYQGELYADKIIDYTDALKEQLSLIKFVK